MNVPPALRRWGIRLVLAVVVAIGLGYLPGEVLRRDPRAAMLEGQLDELDKETAAVSERNATLARQVHALSTDVRAIEDRARADLGMVYPGEITIRVQGTAP